MTHSVAGAELAFDGNADTARRGRRFLSETLATWDVGDVDFTASLVLSELVTNAVLHANTEIVVRLSPLVNGVRIEVEDGSSRVPLPRRYALDATTGRGLALVDALSQSWGVELTANGKTVWSEVTVDIDDPELRPDGRIRA